MMELFDDTCREFTRPSCWTVRIFLGKLFRASQQRAGNRQIFIQELSPKEGR